MPDTHDPAPHRKRRNRGECDFPARQRRADSTVKATLYAHAGIREYWVVDVVGRQVFVHQKPTAAGYTEIRVYGSDEQVATLARPDSATRVADLLPPTA